MNANTVQMRIMGNKLRHIICAMLMVAALQKSAAPLAAQIVINEIMATNTAQFLDPTGNFSGFIELYNPTDAAVSVRRWMLSDDPAVPAKWRLPSVASSTVPAHGYLLVWCDHNNLSERQTTFKLDADGGTILLSNATGTLADQIYFPPQIKGASYARTTDGGTAWNFCSTPTPKATNNNATYASLRCPALDFTQKGGIYPNGTLTTTTTIPAGFTLRYTTDGSEPTASSTQSYGGQFSFTQTSILRARLFRYGYLPGPTATHTYIIGNRNFTLPIISIVANPEFLFSDTMGIYVAGTNGIPGNGSSTGRNWNCDWARAAHIEMIDPNTKRTFFEQEVDVSISGGWSRGWGAKPLSFNAEKKYEGKNRFDFQPFAEKPDIRLKALLLRNSGNDNSSQGGTMMKDALIHTLVGGGVLDVEHQAYRPFIHYINGQYYGVGNLRERNNKQYVFSNYGYESTEIDMFEMHPDSAYVQLQGDNIAWLQLVTLSAQAATASVYEQIKQKIDIEEFINYMAVEFYIGNWDWPQNNVKGWRNRNGGKFRFNLYDLEGGWSEANKNSFSEFNGKNTHTFDDGKREEIKLVTFFRNLLNNAEFKRQFIAKYCLLAGSIFSPARVSAIADSLSAVLLPEASYQNSRWGGSLGNITAFKNFGNNRPAYALSTIKTALSINTTAQTVQLSSALPQGQIYVNEQAVPLNKFDGKLYPPVTLRADTPVGWQFAGWREVSTASEVNVFPKGSQWKYYDSGSLDGQNWTSTSFPASNWATGNAPLGYQTNGFNNVPALATTVSYGDDASSRQITTYFRRTFTLAQPPAVTDQFVLHLVIDDGCVVYINGTEAGRYLMPSGNVVFATTASSYATANPDQTEMVIASTLFQQGENTICIEVHQHSSTSSDIYLDAALGKITENGSSTLIVENEYTLPATGSFSLQATYTPLAADLLPVPLRINEISASNTIYQNEYFKRNDWIEIYNTTAQSQDLAGMYLSNDAGNRLRYQFPSNRPDITVVEANGYKIVWCDNMADSTQLHADFKLSAAGGLLLLTAADQSWTDTICYAEMPSGAVSVGRFPDGNSAVYLFNRPSFRTTNLYSIYSTVVSQIVPDGVEEVLSHQQHTDFLWYNSQQRVLPISSISAENLPATLQIVNLNGQIQSQKTLQSVSDKIITLPALPAGMYMAVIRWKNGQTAICKFVQR